jgi:hypothetical protein
MHLGTPVVPDEKQDVERMRERQLRTNSTGRAEKGAMKSSSVAAPACRAPRHGIAGIVDDDAGHPRLLATAVDLCLHILQLAAVPIGIAGDEELGLDLAETVEHTLLSEIGGTGRPDGADRGGCQHEGHRLRHVRHHRSDAIARTDALRTQRLLQPGHEVAQPIPGPAIGDLVLTAENDGFACSLAGQQVFGEVQRRIREKPCIEHDVAIDKRAGAAGALDLAEIPDRRPEAGPLGNRPGMQIIVAWTSKGRRSRLHAA